MAIGRITCGRCRMQFRVAEPHHADIGEGVHQTTITHCSVPGCGRRFWHSTKGQGRARRAVVGVFPADIPLCERPGFTAISGAGNSGAQIVRHPADNPGEGAGEGFHDTEIRTAGESKQ